MTTVRPSASKLHDDTNVGRKFTKCVQQQHGRTVAARVKVQAEREADGRLVENFPAISLVVRCFGFAHSFSFHGNSVQSVRGFSSALRRRLHTARTEECKLALVGCCSDNQQDEDNRALNIFLSQDHDLSILLVQHVLIPVVVSHSISPPLPTPTFAAIR